MPDRYVLDASALLCLIHGEPGADRVAARLGGAVIGAVNLSEVVAKIIDRGGSPAHAAAILDPLHLDIVDFDAELAMRAGALRAETRAAGLSFGDRACLALAQARGLGALTCDRTWEGLDTGVPVELAR